MMDLTDIQFNS